MPDFSPPLITRSPYTCATHTRAHIVTARSAHTATNATNTPQYTDTHIHPANPMHTHIAPPATLPLLQSVVSQRERMSEREGLQRSNHTMLHAYPQA